MTDVFLAAGVRTPFVKAGGVYSCAKDSHEMAKNTGTVQAVMRVVMLMPA